MKRKIAVLGGDQRQVCLARLLYEDGWNTVTWGLEKADTSLAVSLDRALEAEIVVLPLPVCRGEDLNLSLTDIRLPVNEVVKRLRPDQLILGGMVRSLPEAFINGDCPKLYDYYDREEIQIFNAVPTAEGAIMRAIEKTQGTLYGSRCLVVGYGRIGKVLSHRLHHLGADVTVSARKRSDLAWGEVYGYRTVHTEKIVDRIGDYDLIFNTVPSMVLDAACLKEVKQSCILIELASPPGGIDREAVKEYNLHLLEERGLPGIIAPEASAKVIRDAIYHILEEQGERE